MRVLHDGVPATPEGVHLLEVGGEHVIVLRFGDAATGCAFDDPAEARDVLAVLTDVIAALHRSSDQS